MSNENTDMQVVYKDSQAIQNTYLNPSTWGQMRAIADTLVRSGALPKDVKNAEQAMIKMQTGLEMGMKPMQAMQRLYIVNGSVLPWGAETVNRLKQHGWEIEYQEKENECTAIVKKKIGKGYTKYEETFTFQMAVDSEYTEMDEWNNGRKTGNKILKPGWRLGANRKLKLRYHALAMIIKSYIPEVLGGETDIAEVAMDYVEPVQEPIEKQTLKPVKTEKVENSEEFNKKRKQFFALVQELGGDTEKAKEKIKKKYEVKSFNDLNLIQLVGAITMLKEIKASGKKVKKKKEENNETK